MLNTYSQLNDLNACLQSNDCDYSHSNDGAYLQSDELNYFLQ